MKILTYERLLFFVALVIFILVIYSLKQKNFIKEKEPEITTTFTPTPTRSKSPLLVKGSIPYWDQEKAGNAFVQNVSAFDYVNLFWYYVGQDASIRKYEYANEDKDLIEFARQNQVGVNIVITNLPEFLGATWDSKRIENILGSEILRKKHIQEIVDLLTDLNADGVIIDYESLRPSTKVQFSNFIKEVSEELHKENKKLAVVLHPKTGENVNGEAIGAFQDWEEIGKYSDQLQIMGYSQHSDEDRPGPIAGADWASRIISYAKSKNIPEEKIFLGIPLYGYDWNKVDGQEAEGLTYEDVKSLISQNNIEVSWDDKSASPHFHYSTNHEVWFENARSIEEKVKLAQEANLGGVTFWRLGGEDPEIWEIIKKYK